MSSAVPIASDPTAWAAFPETWDAKSTTRVILLLTLSSVFLIRYLTGSKPANFPLVNPAPRFELVGKARKAHFNENSQKVLAEGNTKANGGIFNVNTEHGVLTVLPPEYIDIVRDEKGLSFTATVAEDFHGDIPGFEPFDSATEADALVQAVVRKQLTKSLNKVTLPLSEEASFAIDLNFGQDTEWREMSFMGPIQDVIARMSARVFLGPVCRNEDWLEITKNYTVNGFRAADSLRQYPHWMRRIVAPFKPEVRNVRGIKERAVDIIAPVIQERKKARQDALASGEKPPTFDDALDWFDQEAKGLAYDVPVVELTLAMAAIHTTSDLTTKTMLHLARRPQLVTELREEISSVVREHGWKKASLFNMRLLDSVVKETQRLEPIGITTMNRKATADITLPNGTFIPKGTRLACSTDRHLDPDIYPEPLTFKGDRFRVWRGTEKDNKAHLVSTGPASAGFGHGTHSCPGRFFAANEIKVALCHLLMKYEWKLGGGEEWESIVYGFSCAANPGAKMMVKRRAEVEIDIDSIV